MVSARIIRDSAGISVLSYSFPVGRGFIFPYGKFEECMGGNMSFPSRETEKKDEAAKHLDRIGVKRPTLKEIFQIYNFLLKLPEDKTINDLVNLPCSYPIFAFNPAALVPSTQKIYYAHHSITEGVAENERMITEDVEKFRFSSAPANLKPNNSLLNLLGEEGIKEVQKFLAHFKPAGKYSLAGKLIACLNSRFYDIQINRLDTIVSQDFLYLDKSPGKWLKGYPYVQIEQSGVGDFSFYGGYDLLRIIFDFWPNESEASVFGYTFGILE